MRDAWEQMGPLLMLRGEGGGGGERGGDKEAGDGVRDAPVGEGEGQGS